MLTLQQIMNSRLLAITIIFIIAKNATAQYNFKPGYIIKGDGKTIGAFIVDSDSAQYTKVCKYTLREDQPLMQVNADQIKGYHINGGGHFVSQRMAMEAKSQSVFMEQLTVGEIQLLRMQTQYLILRNGVLSEIHQESLQSDLSISLQGCPYITKKITEVKWSRTSITEIVRQYNECIHADADSYNGSLPNIRIVSSLYLGLDKTSLAISSNDVVPNVKLTDTTPLTAGFILNISSPRKLKRLSFRTGAFYKPSKLYSLVQDPNTVTEFEFRIQQINIPISLQYMFKAGPQVNYSVFAGLSKPILISYSSHLLVDTYPSADVIIQNESKPITSVSQPLQWMCGATATHKFLEKNHLAISIVYSRGIGNIATQNGNSDCTFSDLLLIAGFVF